MDLKEAITAAMDGVIKRTKVTLDEGNQPRFTDQSALSKEERDFYILMFGDDIAAVRHRRLHCTACSVHIGSAPINSWNMFAHPVLLTLLCANCRKFYGDGNFEQGEDATDMFCRWCANGGNLYCCSYCSNTFCNKCIRRNFDPLIRKKIKAEEKWKCFVCDPTDLYTSRAVCWALLQHIQTVTRILNNDRTLSNKEFMENMNLDESRCCVRKRTVKRQKLSIQELDDETSHASYDDISLSLRRKISKRSPRTSISNGEEERPTPNAQIPIKAQPPDTDGFNEDDDDLAPPMIPCVQLMVEGDSSETLNETINSQSNYPQLSSSGDKDGSASVSQTLHINPIPTANLLKVVPPPLTPIRNNVVKRKSPRALQHILPAPATKFLMVKNLSPQNCPTPSSVHTIEYSSQPLRAPSVQPSTPMVAIPSTTSAYKQGSRISVQKPKPTSTRASTPVKEVGVIEINSDSDEGEVEESSDRDKIGQTVCRSRDILKHMLSKGLQESPKFPDLHFKRKGEKANKVEEEIDLRTEEVRVLFKMVGTKLRKVPLLHLPNHNNLRSTRVKTRRFHLALTKAISTLSEINDKVVHKYSSWRKSMLEESRQTRSSDVTASDITSGETLDDVIPLDMTCTNSESESDNADEYDSDSMVITDKVKNVKSFQERDTIDVGVGDPIPTADKCVQAFDVIEKDYEKCIGHSVLTKIEYDPMDGSEISKPVIVPAEYNGKFEEQFIFYLQHREENEVETDDDKGLPDPNETPLKDLIEANSPFVLEMLESIDSPLASGLATSELATETSNESGKENEDQSEPTNVVKELAKIVTELSEDLKTSRNSETLAKKHSEHNKKDRRKQVLENIESEEVDIAVQTLIEEDERSRSSSNDDEIVSRHIKQLTTGGRPTAGLGYSEDECTIIE